ncbi:hypothetical protein ACQP3L_33570, partial [Escherichia coli]
TRVLNSGRLGLDIKTTLGMWESGQAELYEFEPSLVCIVSSRPAMDYILRTHIKNPVTTTTILVGVIFC